MHIKQKKIHSIIIKYDRAKSDQKLGQSIRLTRYFLSYYNIKLNKRSAANEHLKLLLPSFIHQQHTRTRAHNIGAPSEDQFGLSSVSNLVLLCVIVQSVLGSLLVCLQLPSFNISKLLRFFLVHFFFLFLVGSDSSFSFSACNSRVFVVQPSGIYNKIGKCSFLFLLFLLIC